MGNAVKNVTSNRMLIFSNPLPGFYEPDMQEYMDVFSMEVGKIPGFMYTSL